ncbi:hypothetical protein LCGC14_1826370 [marine sediment metagenome]|uniref:Uncharacterized protein n=1 Tax=marine sediment metagenome TaxID=412755 RepID=A0A0F9H5H7_9ZZZZ
MTEGAKSCPHCRVLVPIGGVLCVDCSHLWQSGFKRGVKDAQEASCFVVNEILKSDQHILKTRIQDDIDKVCTDLIK